MAGESMQKVTSIEADTLDAILSAGGWSNQADDNVSNEQLPEALVKRLVGDTAGDLTQASFVGAGLLTLTLAVAEWGVAWTAPEAPEDPARHGWAGPTSIGQGKHLMSYALGGIGVAHLDADAAVRFLKVVSERVPAAKPDLDVLSPNFRYDPIRARGGVCAPDPHHAVLMTDLDGKPFEHDAAYLGGASYCDRFNPQGELNADAWQRLRHWCRVGLRRRDVQEWVLVDWLNNFFVEAAAEVMGHPHGTLRETMVVARILNSSRGDMRSALRAAENETDPDRRIAAELHAYSQVSNTHAGRTGVMQRPGAVMKAIAAG